VKRATPKLVVLSLALIAVGALLSGPTASGASGGGSAQKKLTIWAVATRAQYLNFADDRARGTGSNPFNADVKSLGPISEAKQKGNGPFPGDKAMYTFKLYTSPGLKKSAGSATYTCTFSFLKKAICVAYFKLNGGTMFGSGPADFTSTRITFAVTGGTSKYLGVRGQVTSAPGAKDEHRLDFVLLN
jgi:hypothetical protein